ncbi:MAG: DUF3990 domain-containing protein [Mogibacterium sp.]|nr:DUF3990 domain-containing protein [Mogibacterium sp.]
MIRILYHGSSRIIRSPKFGAGNAYNDYGIGFYCTDSRALAGQWAVGRSRDGYINCYKLDDSGLRTLDLNNPQYCILHWLGILLNYREFDTLTPQAYQARDYIRTAYGIDHQSYDCIVGYRADDLHFAYAQSFLNGEISYQQLNDAVRMSGLGRQFVLKSNRAFDRLLFNGYKIALSSELYPVRIAREYKALEGIASAVGGAIGGAAKDTSGVAVAGNKAGRDAAQGLYISQILEEEIKSYDPRLR